MIQLYDIFIINDINRLKLKRQKKIYKSDCKRCGVAMLTTRQDKIQNKTCYQRQKIFYDNKKVDLSRRLNNYKHIGA